eukprot:3865290-Pyramimonas_sp.AAC.1
MATAQAHRVLTCSRPVSYGCAMRTQGPWTPIPKLFERARANESGPGRTEEVRMQGPPWEGCPFL